MDTTQPIEIAGAGPAGLVAAITLARAGKPVTVFERQADVGTRFHGDFQGLENWTTPGDVVAELESMGIDPDFEHTGFRQMTWFDAGGREYRFHSPAPLWYLLRRGTDSGTLDQALKAQALKAGVNIVFNSGRASLPDGGIVAHGPHRPDAIAAGFVFDTDRDDAAFGVAADHLAPKGYGYLLYCGGRGTVASCMFADFHNEKTYVERTVAFFREKTGLEMTNPRPFGGFGNVFPSVSARKGKLLYVGEAAGFQDALFGFGMRYAMSSGHLAARALMNGTPEQYDPDWRARFGRFLKGGMINRMLYERFGDAGYRWLLHSLDRASDTRAWMRRYYSNGPLKSLLYPLAKRQSQNKKALISDCLTDCRCTWCKCRNHQPAPACD